MVYDADCVFCKILKREIPSFTILEDERTYAFMDINPANPGHALVIPKFHAPTIFAIPDDWLSACIVTARKVARAVQNVTPMDGLNIVQANGIGAAQSVPHFHFHVMPRTTGDGLGLNWDLVPGNKAEIAALCEKIKTELMKA
ncbi:MAG: HIT family protein [Alphaproteobacteria bacterium]|nr:HIT family protein [Alphaproteobacteria bacterium]